MDIDKQFVDSLILGSLLGDGHIERARGNNTNSRIGFTHNSKADKELNYISLKRDLISKFYTVNTLRHAHHNTLRFDLSTLDSNVNILVDRLVKMSRYDDNSRKLPDIEFFDAIVMLFWYLDDGSLTIGFQKRPNGRKSSISRRLKITLSSYKDEDIINFVKEFKDKFGIEFKLQRERNKITQISIKDINEMSKFLDMINPYIELIPKEQHYKFCMCYHDTLILKENNMSKYNQCNFHNSGICDCRGKDMSSLY